MSRRKKEISDETEKHAQDETLDEIPYFKEIWNKLDQYEEEYLPSNEIQKHHCNLQKRSDEINIDSQYLKLVNKFVKLKLQGNQSDEKDISRLARFYLKNEKENDEDELLLDEELGVFPTKCPISQMPFENPVTQRFSKNRKACVHTFEKAFILRLMHNKDTIECPIAACKKKVYKSSLHPDYEFLHHSRYKKFRDHITDALEYFNNIRNEEKEILDFAE